MLHLQAGMHTIHIKAPLVLLEFGGHVITYLIQLMYAMGSVVVCSSLY